MKLKKIFSAVLACMIFMLGIPASVFTSSAAGNYQAALERALASFKKSSDYNIEVSRYSIFDVNNDGIPELFVGHGTMSGLKQSVYLYDGSEYVYRDGFNHNNGSFCVDTSNGYLVLYSSLQGINYHTF